MNDKINPLAAFIKANGYLLTGRLHFPREHVGKMIRTPDGRQFRVFREGRVDPDRGWPEKPGATFIVRFHTKMPPRLNKLFSLLPMPVCIGCPGFRTKFWMMDEETGDFQGLYEWNTVENAENYAHSVALTFMTNRSVPGSVSYQVFPSDREDLLESRALRIVA